MLYLRDNNWNVWKKQKPNLSRWKKEHPDSVEEQRNPGVFTLIQTRWWDCSFCYKWWRDILCRCYIYTDSTYSITLLTFLCPFCAHGPALIGDRLAGWKAVIYNKGACTRLVCFPYAFGMYG